MSSMTPASRVSVLSRIRDLREWALFIHESLSQDRSFQRGTREILAAYMGEAFLQDFDQESRRLIDKLDQMIDRIVATAKPLEQLGPPDPKRSGESPALRIDSAESIPARAFEGSE